MKASRPYHYIITITLALSVFWACSKTTQPDDADPASPPDTTRAAGEVPQVETLEVTNITRTTAEGGGKIIANGSSGVKSRGLCWNTTGSPTAEDAQSDASSILGSGEFTASLDNLTDNTTYYVRAYGVNEAGTGYGNEVTFKTAPAEVPVVEVETDYAAGTETAFISARVISEKGYPVTERGICWGKEPDPDVSGQKSSEGEGPGSFLGRIEGLEPETVYYVRAYATSSKGTGYSETIQVRTIPKGNINYTIHKIAHPSEELQTHYTRIEQAFEQAAYYYENFTSIEKELNVYYNPNVPTADGHINGTIRMGSNPSYQQTGTAMHEIMHTVGVGQHWMWNELISGGKYQGEHANRMLQIMTGDTTAVISGDGLHFWPYGINGAHEDTGEETLYIIHALIVQGMKKDGLPSH